jgi:hypothetical protein
MALITCGDPLHKSFEFSGGDPSRSRQFLPTDSEISKATACSWHPWQRPACSGYHPSVG